MGDDPLCDSFSVMNGSSILQQDHRTPQMPKQVTQEGSDIQPHESTAAQPEIERHALARGRHSQGADRGDPISCLYRSRTIGVRPFGAQVRATLGMSRKPDSSRKTRWAPRGPAFFYMRRAGPFPSGDRGLVPLQRAAFGVLTAPSQLGQELPDMTGMVAYPELLVDQLRHTFQGP